MPMPFCQNCCSVWWIWEDANVIEPSSELSRQSLTELLTRWRAIQRSLEQRYVIVSSSQSTARVTQPSFIRSFISCDYSEQRARYKRTLLTALRRRQYMMTIVWRTKRMRGGGAKREDQQNSAQCCVKWAVLKGELGPVLS